MTNRNRKILKVIFSVALLTVVIFFTGRFLIYRKIQTTLQDRLGNLRELGIDIRYDYAHINIWKGKIEVYQLKLTLLGDSANQRFESVIPYLLVKGVSIISLIKDNNISIESVALHQPSVTYALSTKLSQRDSIEKPEINFDELNIRQIDISELSLFLKDSLAHDTIARIQSDVKIARFELERKNDSLVWKNAKVDISKFAMNLPKSLYACAAKVIQFDIGEKVFQADSINLKPTRSRKQFAKAFGKEVDYIVGSIPNVKITGVNWFSYPTNALEVEKVVLNFKASVYRDKRYPLIKSHRSVLPIHFLQRLSIQLKADSIAISNSYVSYEEYPEQGDSSGLVYFDKLNAIILSVHNDASHKQDMQMKANAKFMGVGNLSVDFTFPYDTTRAYRARGTLKNFPLPKLNDMLGAAASVRIESGVMTRLTFNFLYNMYRSDGKVVVNYNDLKISALRENNNNEQTVNRLKTLLLNTLIIKKNMDGDVSQDKRSGTILFHRDAKRSVINYWAKSVLSGIISAYNLDKIPITAQNNKKEKGKTN